MLKVLGARAARCRRVASAAVLLLFSVAAAPPGGPFAPALPGYELEFPRDHGAHREYQTEWWYYTGHLTADDGSRYGFELTFFRVGVERAPAVSRWDLRDLALAHFAITDVGKRSFRYYEKTNRESPFTARAATGMLDVFNEGWRASTNPDGSWRLVAGAGEDALELTLRPDKPPAVHGENGISQKAVGAGYASHYYSMTRLDAEGRLNGRRCRGEAWMDHEFGSAGLREAQQGWDWFSVQLDDETELMLYLIRRRDGSADVTSSGSIVTSDGTVIHLRREQLRVTPTGRWRSPCSRTTYPMGWRIEVPAYQLALTLRPLLEDQELITRASTGVTYWEGAVDATGSFGAVAVSGHGYVEMTGYDRAFRRP